MVGFFRKWAWKFLGNKYYQFLKGNNSTWLKNSSWAKIGQNTYDNGAFVWKWYDGSPLEIGKYCSIAANVHFVCDSGYHTQSEVTSFPLFHQIAPKNHKVNIDGTQYRISDIQGKLRPRKSGITIGNDVWIGMNATILPGITIGNGATILAGAVVSRDVPDYAVTGGVPADTVKFKHDADTIAALNKIAWWDWPNEKMLANLDDFYLPIGEFIQKYR
jgi:acetyltransferase-like isoleucine patch superfamily enzyme